MMKFSILVLPLRGAQMFVSFVILGLSGYVANWYNVDTLTPSPGQINFLIFAPLFSILSILYIEGAPRFMPRLAHPLIALGVEALNVLFYFSGMIALAVFLNTLLFCRGTVCGSARADAGMAGLQWLLFVATTVINTLDVVRGGIRKASRAGAKGSYPKEMKEASVA